MQIFDELDSTQIEAKRQIDVKKIITEDAILAKKQTAGVSTKKDYPWVSQEGDLNVSIILNAKYLLQNGNLSTKLLSFPAGLAMLDEILNVKEKSGKNFKPVLKWPNDILIERGCIYRKICGILCENYKDHFIIGIGCNLVSHPEKTGCFPATDLLSESDVKLDCIELAMRLILSFKNKVKQMQTYGFESIKNRWKQHAYMLGETLLLRDGGEITFEDIDNDGCIIGKNRDGNTQVIKGSNEVIGGRQKNK